MNDDEPPGGNYLPGGFFFHIYIRIHYEEIRYGFTFAYYLYMFLACPSQEKKPGILVYIFGKY
jgi:hypothetical protein